MSDDENANPNSGSGVGAPLRTILGLFFLFLVIGMCLPRLSTPRSHTEKSFCQANMRNAVLAILNYEAVNKAYPQAVPHDATGQVARSWRVEVLPQYSQQAVSDRYDDRLPWNDPVNLEIAKIQLPFFQCPVARHDPKRSKYFTTSYVLITGIHHHAQWSSIRFV